MMFNVVLDFLIFIIEVVLINLALNVLANIIHISSTIRNRIILAVIAVALTTILFFAKQIASPPNICKEASSDLKNYISTGNRSLIQQKTPNEKEREQQIYDNNKKVDPNNSYLLAVAIPANAQPESARAMLAGVADAQTKFNQLDQSQIIPTNSKKTVKNCSC